MRAAFTGFLLYLLVASGCLFATWLIVPPRSWPTDPEPFSKVAPIVLSTLGFLSVPVAILLNSRISAIERHRLFRTEMFRHANSFYAALSDFVFDQLPEAEVGAKIRELKEVRPLPKKEAELWDDFVQEAMNSFEKLRAEGDSRQRQILWASQIGVLSHHLSNVKEI